jgi:hypothetical protein
LPDDPNIEQLLRSLELTKEQVHNLNLKKLDPNRIRTERDIAEQDNMRRTYPLLEGTTTAKAALQNCVKLSSLISTVNSEDAEKIGAKVDHAIDTLASADSPSKIDDWYREELTPLLTEVEKTGKDVLQSAVGRSDYHRRGHKLRSGLSVDKS